MAPLQDRTLVCPIAAQWQELPPIKALRTVCSALLPGLWGTQCFPANLREIQSGFFGVKLSDHEKVLRGLPELR